MSLLRLVDLGLKSWDILDQQEFEEDELVCIQFNAGDTPTCTHPHPYTRTHLFAHTHAQAMECVG